MSPTNNACSSLTLSGIRFNPWSAWGTLTCSACPPSILHPKAHPPFGSVQLLTCPCLQKKHSPQKVSTFTVTRSPGLTVRTLAPVSSTMPTISCPTVTPLTARGTLPCLMCKSLVQILPSVTRTMASSSSCKVGLGFSTSSNLPCSIYVYASMSSEYFLANVRNSFRITCSWLAASGDSPYGGRFLRFVPVRFQFFQFSPCLSSWWPCAPCAFRRQDAQGAPLDSFRRLRFLLAGDFAQKPPPAVRLSVSCS